MRNHRYCFYDHVVSVRLMPLARIVRWTRELRLSAGLEAHEVLPSSDLPSHLERLPSFHMLYHLCVASQCRAPEQMHLSSVNLPVKLLGSRDLHRGWARLTLNVRARRSM